MNREFEDYRSSDMKPEDKTGLVINRIRRRPVVLGIVAMIAAVVVSAYWMTNKPKAQRHRPPPKAMLVETRPLVAENYRTTVGAMGNVIPSRSIQLKSFVSGEIIEVSPKFIPGGQFNAGDLILKIDPTDYRLAVQQRSDALVKARADFRIEMGKQDIARAESDMLGEDIIDGDRELLLRAPQLAIAEANVSSARAVLDQAKIDLARTIIQAPFNAMIQTRKVDVGSQVSIGTVLADLVGIDEYWIQVFLPVDQLKWFDIPGVNSETGSRIRVYHETAWGSGIFRTGIVERLLADLEPQGRMAQLLVSVQDPLGLGIVPGNRHRLILGAFVRIEIDGRELPPSFRLPRTALRDGNRIWIMLPDNTLDIRPVDVIWQNNQDVYISDGIQEGDMLVISDLGAPVQGMSLRTIDTNNGNHSQSQRKPPDENESGI